MDIMVVTVTGLAGVAAGVMAGRWVLGSILALTFGKRI
jgi:hypothetical protein